MTASSSTRSASASTSEFDAFDTIRIRPGALVPGRLVVCRSSRAARASPPDGVDAIRADRTHQLSARPRREERRVLRRADDRRERLGPEQRVAREPHGILVPEHEPAALGVVEDRWVPVEIGDRDELPVRSAALDHLAEALQIALA